MALKTTKYDRGLQAASERSTSELSPQLLLDLLEQGGGLRVSRVERTSNGSRFGQTLCLRPTFFIEFLINASTAVSVIKTNASRTSTSY